MKNNPGTLATPPSKRIYVCAVHTYISLQGGPVISADRLHHHDALEDLPKQESQESDHLY